MHLPLVALHVALLVALLPGDADGHGIHPHGDGSGKTPGVRSVSLDAESYEWAETEAALQDLLEAALGPEVAYWRRRRVTCEDVAATVTRLHSAFLDGVRAVLILNNTWHFLDPVRGGQQQLKQQAGSAEGVPRYAWPPLRLNPKPGCSSPCQGQLRTLHAALSQKMAEAPASYRVPDMVAVINAADNMQRFGRGSRAPVLSLLKWWRVPWWNGTTTSLGRINGSLLRAMPLPSRVAALLNADGAHSSSSSSSRSRSRSTLRRRRRQLQEGQAGSTAAAAAAVGAVDAHAAASVHGAAQGQGGAAVHDALHAAVGRFVRERPLLLPPGVDQEPLSDSNGGGGAAAAAEAASFGGGGALQQAVDAAEAAEAGAGAAIAEGAGASSGGPSGVAAAGAAAAAAEGRMPWRRRRRRDGGTAQYDMDLLLPTLAYAPAALYVYPEALKQDVAFFSGVPYCPLYRDLHGMCLRAFMANLSTLYGSDLDVRLTKPYRGKRLGAHGAYRTPVTLPRSAPTPLSAHATRRFLLNLDGFAGSSRMGLLMAVGSTLLKSRSPFIEYYSRLQVPGAHYLEFWKNPADPLDVLAVLAEARRAAAEDPDGLAAAAAANSAIAARYIARVPKLAYARAVLLSYVELVPDMPACVADLLSHLGAAAAGGG